MVPLKETIKLVVKLNMTKIKYLIVVLIVMCLSACQQKNNEKKYEKIQSLPFGSIKPTGWISNQIVRDLDIGITGKFNEISNTVSHELFVNSNRRSDTKYNGLKGWWSGEHEGYWKDAVLRGAFLTDHGIYKKRATQWVNDILTNLDDSGYIGIYEKENRYNHKGENGELWTKSRIIMPLLAYYEYTNDKKVLDAVEKSVKLTISHYNNKTAWTKGEGGVSHGIGYFEILEWLYRLTRNPLYTKFSEKLYADFCQAELRDDDLKTKNLINV